MCMSPPKPPQVQMVQPAAAPPEVKAPPPAAAPPPSSTAPEKASAAPRSNTDAAIAARAGDLAIRRKRGKSALKVPRGGGVYT